MSNNVTLTAGQKALQINLDATIYGSFVEIGAGQEVARNFFKVGSASTTIAKTMSAYDKDFSDAIYGKEKDGRYVCKSRLEKIVQPMVDWIKKKEELIHDKWHQNIPRLTNAEFCDLTNIIKL